ncbi:hypothetical protein IE4872_PC00085 (plasmid) [Rhizobium gallicum]|uniref:Transcriptional regulator SyrB protein n=1 Tax=Rhizobium gallicum TaxID=56730 RepID=A0A1L5NQD4_9HYPH|nr:hypothetical protein IE4872_PC00085 [Rhizobium gallicum]
MDLKSVTRDVREEAMPFLSPVHPNVASDEGISSPETEQIQPLLTAPVAQQTSALATQETDMADENDTMVDTNTPATVVAALDAPTKQRKPRTKKAAPELGSSEIASEPADASRTATATVDKQGRGRKPKASVGTNATKSVPVKRGPRTDKAAAAAPTSVFDDLAGLLQLEEENQRLRKLLAEKLRAENAELRKRLNLG